MHGPYLKQPQPPCIISAVYEQPALSVMVYSSGSLQEPEIAMHASNCVIFTPDLFHTDATVGQ